MTVTVIGNNTGDDYSDVDSNMITDVGTTTVYHDEASVEITTWDGVIGKVGLFKFGGLSNIGASEVVSAVTLGLYKYDGDSLNQEYTFRRILRNYVPTETTYNEWATGSSWTTAGALSEGNDVSATVTVAKYIGTTLNEYKLFSDTDNSQLKTDVQNFIDGSVANYGWHDYVSNPSRSYGFVRGTTGTDGQRPYLTVTHAAGGATLVIADATHGHTADNLTLTQDHQLVIADALHAHTADALTLTQLHVLQISAALHSHMADSPALTQDHQLVIAEALHAHAADNIALTQDHILAIAGALHGHAADNVTLTTQGDLVIADATHSHTADSPTLTQQHILTIADALHAHAADNLTLQAGLTLSIADAAHAHSADNITLTQAHVLAIQEALHAHSADSIALTQDHTLIISDTLHAHLADIVTLTTGGITVPTNAGILLVDDTRAVLVIADTRSIAIGSDDRAITIH